MLDAKLHKRIEELETDASNRCNRELTTELEKTLNLEF